jgi:hypothetical protein
MFVDQLERQIVAAIPMAVNIIERPHWWVKERCYDQILLSLSLSPSELIKPVQDGKG